MMPKEIWLWDEWKEIGLYDMKKVIWGVHILIDLEGFARYRVPPHELTRI